MPAAPIHVEIEIRGGLDALWAHTQDPALHQRWDLRFSTIAYLPRAAGEPQRFLYQTRIGAGMAISGTGESTAETAVGGVRTSVLRFASDDPRSLIASGGGYWKYLPDAAGGDAVRFLTRYTYACRFGALGAVVDRLAFRPLLGWATAISFDCLRLWVERGIPPEVSWQRLRIHVVARLAGAAIWLWHGLVPKLLVPRDELALLAAAGVGADAARTLVTVAGIGEVLMAALLLTRWRWPLHLTLLAMPPLALAACLARPELLTAPFTPVTLGAALAALAALALLSARDLPSATRCRRTPSAATLSAATPPDQP